MERNHQTRNICPGEMEEEEEGGGAPPGNIESLFQWLRLNSALTTKKPASPIIHKRGEWIEIRLFLSSTFIDTHAERDALIKRIIPSLNRKFAAQFIRFG